MREPRKAQSAATTEPSPFFRWVSALVHAHRARLVRLVRREGLREEDALDCVQEAFHSFLKLPQARLLVEEPDDSIKLLTVLAKNIARNRRRRHDLARPHEEGALEVLPGELPSVEALLARAEEHILLTGCVATLGELQRAVVTLRMLDEVPGEDVAKLLGTSPGNVAILLHRAKARLRGCMTGAGYEPSAG
jgi:RNA polymerase sigma-70 factor, ECF subfamily